jgi:thioredoxin 1
MAGNVLEITDGNFDSEVAGSSVPVLLDFWAAWCAPCRMLTPTVEAIAKDYDGRAKVGKLNVDENNEISAKYGIKGIPTLILFKNGVVMLDLTKSSTSDPKKIGRSPYNKKINTITSSKTILNRNVIVNKTDRCFSQTSPSGAGETRPEPGGAC